MHSVRLVYLCALAAGICALFLAAPGRAETINFGSVSPFTGGDPGEGLDLTGSFAYAVNVDGPLVTPGNPFPTFTAGASTVGYSITGGSIINPWAPRPNYGPSSADDTLETLMQSVRWSGLYDDVSIALSVQQGTSYKLQLLFSEQSGGRNPGTRDFDIRIEGQMAVDGISLNGTIVEPPTEGRVYTYEFTAQDSTLNIGLTRGQSSFDPSSIIQALTLETVPEPATLSLLALGGLAIIRRRRK